MNYRFLELERCLLITYLIHPPHFRVGETLVQGEFRGALDQPQNSCTVQATEHTNPQWKAPLYSTEQTEVHGKD